jgi:hypothetical protein
VRGQIAPPLAAQFERGQERIDAIKIDDSTARAEADPAKAACCMARNHTTAPANSAPGNTARPWNSRAPFQIMPQAMNSSALGSSGVTTTKRSWVPQSVTAKVADQVRATPPRERSCSHST